MSRTVRKISVLTGKRGGFGALIPTIQLMEQEPCIDLSVIATDMHLSEKFGKTIAEVEQWVKKVVCVPMGQENDQAVSRAKALATCMQGMASVLDAIQPDILLVLGDRGEVVAAALAALHLGIPLAHIQGGDISGNIDEMMRHAITKMSHIHFPSTEQSAERIRLLGEEPWRIHVIGDPHIDMIVQKRYTPGKEARKIHAIAAEEPFALVLVHPETLDTEHSYQNMRTVLAEMAAREMRTLVIFPCSDHGHQGILDAIAERAGQPHFSFHKNIEAVHFWGLMSEAQVLIGNSSAGLIEAPYFNLPVINLGTRQTGRQRWINVLDCPFESSAFRTALEKAGSDAFRTHLANCKEKPFGDGTACKRIVHVLKTVPLDKHLKEKRMTY
jgi:GDP/UDP-N,N'-diacetylbacillosamine 2-epimerase (hydrolysing)